MNKENLVWKYFLEQKVFEIFAVIAILLVGWFVVIGLPMAIGQSIGDGYSRFCEDNWERVIECNIFYIWIEGFIYLMVVGFVGFLIFLWFINNWQKAEKKVEKEIKEQKRNKRRKRK